MGAQWRKRSRFPLFLRSDPPCPVVIETVLAARSATAVVLHMMSRHRISAQGRLPGTKIVEMEQEGTTATVGDEEVKAAVGARDRKKATTTSARDEEGAQRSEEEEESALLNKKPL
ncbi:hypothetical protein E2562_001738 [Oryza meyeriana var. granulata]|uniref:Uncharacterized protein n=1 Tax=Oryza meyeriana var. granulata TaxID=110450 RepID=A0A6G1CDG9_9ORYZ|nr:hypothetical protein E2562_001738 [Oryza meyeriana var. granulata]